MKKIQSARVRVCVCVCVRVCVCGERERDYPYPLEYYTATDVQTTISSWHDLMLHIQCLPVHSCVNSEGAAGTLVTQQSVTHPALARTRLANYYQVVVRVVAVQPTVQDINHHQNAVFGFARVSTVAGLSPPPTTSTNLTL